MLNLYLCEYYLWYGKKGAGKLKMECCIRIFESGVARRRGSRIIGIVMIIMLAAGLVCELPALEFTESDAAYRMIYGKYNGKELVAYGTNSEGAGALDIFGNAVNRMPVKTNINKLLKENKRVKSMTEQPEAEQADLLSDFFLMGIEIPAIGGISETEVPNLNFTGVHIPESPTGNVTPPVIPDIPAVNDKPSVPDAPITPDNPIVPDLPIVPDTPLVPDNPPVDDDPAVPPDVVVPDTPDVEAPDIPGENDDPNNGTDEPAIEQTAGFTVNEDGMICAYDPSAGIVKEGRLVLPAEGCSGIARGTFEGVGAEIYELFIPPNIVNIESGVLSELTDLGWIQLTEPNTNYTWQDGMLFDSSMTTLLAFPCGRIGTYALPSNVTRLEDYSFLNTNLTKIDMMKCGIVEVGSNVFGGNGGNGITIMAPREHLEHYQKVFAELGVTIR